jgi:hypothetical protein
MVTNTGLSSLSAEEPSFKGPFVLVFCIYPGVCRFVAAGSPLGIRLLFATVGIIASIEDVCILDVCVYRISNALLGMIAELPLYHGAVYRLRFENMSRFSAFHGVCFSRFLVYIPTISRVISF